LINVTVPAVRLGDPLGFIWQVRLVVEGQIHTADARALQLCLCQHRARVAEVRRDYVFGPDQTQTRGRTTVIDGHKLVLNFRIRCDFSPPRRLQLGLHHHSRLRRQSLISRDEGADEDAANSVNIYDVIASGGAQFGHILGHQALQGILDKFRREAASMACNNTPQWQQQKCK
jgi:hypothetical protein